MMQKISDLAVLVLVGLVIFMGGFSFMQDLSVRPDGTTKYNLSLPGTTNATMYNILQNMNDTSIEIRDKLLGEKSWSIMDFGIFFTLPNTIIQTLISMANAGTSMIGIAASDESGIGVPGWFITIVILAIFLIVVFVGIRLAMGGEV